jgi:hypothetical protein
MRFSWRALKLGLYFESECILRLGFLAAFLMPLVAPVPALALALVTMTSASIAADDGQQSVAYKATVGTYSTSDVGSSIDFNVRAQLHALQGQHTVWLGWYHTSQGFSQVRSGYELLLDSQWVRPTFSFQWAQGGFLGGSITGELGPKNLFAVVGAGRTNLQPYYNLNFDPNDMIQYGIGWRPHTSASDQTLMLYRIQDNRLNTGQAVTHVTWRDTYGAGHRISTDIFVKRGTLDTGELIRSQVGLGLGYDAEPWFVKAAYDPYVNFTASRMLRLSFGRRF